MEKRLLIVLLCLVGAVSSAFAADRLVQGVVISSEDNLPLIGASVYVTTEDLEKGGKLSSYDWGYHQRGWPVLYQHTFGSDPFLL